MLQEGITIEQKELLGGKYRLLRTLGSGGFGTVYLAEDVRLHRRWAVKKLEREPGGGLHEAEMMRLLDYPSLPRIVELFEARGNSYLVMDYIEGKTIGALLREGKRFTEAEVIETGIVLAETLAYLHSRKPPLIYRDLKPDNVMRTTEGQIKLVDFGTAVRVKAGARERAAGSRGYAAPEQYHGVCDARSDIYGLGMVLKAMSGNKGRRLRRIIRKCSRERREERYQEAGEAAKALRMLQSSREKDRGAAKWLLAGLGVLLACAAGSVFFNEIEETRYGQLMREAVQTEKADEGIALCERAAELFPGREETLLKLLEICIQNERAAEGVRRIEELLELYPDREETYTELYRELGLLCFCGSTLGDTFTADYERAAAYLKRAGEEEPGCRRLGELAEALSGWGREIDWEETAKCLQEIEGRADRMAGGSPAEAAALYRACGSVYFADAQYLEPYLEPFLKNPYKECVRLLEKAEAGYEESEEAYRESIRREIWESISAACYLAGLEEQDAKRRTAYLEEASAYGERLLKTSESDELTQRLLLRQADIFGELGKRREMYQCYETYEKCFPEELEGSCAYAAELLKDGEVQKASEILEKAGQLPGAKENRNYQVLCEELEEGL